MSDIPSGFDGVYRCKNHPGRDAEVPIAMRLCAECLEDARERYSEKRDEPQQRYQDELSTDGRNILADHKGEYKRRESE